MNRRTTRQPLVLTRRAVLAGLLTGTAACTVRPLYAPAPGNKIGPTTAALAGVDVNPVGSRVGQQVRNQLLFLLHGGGAGNPAPTYTADLAISLSDAAVFRTEAPDDVNEITSQLLTMTGTVTLKRTADGVVIDTQTRRATAQYDTTPQQFANDRAKINAENRAARELAQQLRIAIATSLPTT